MSFVNEMPLFPSPINAWHSLISTQNMIKSFVRKDTRLIFAGARSRKMPFEIQTVPAPPTY